MPPHKVIYDTDPGVDDAMGLLFLHHHPDIELLGITTVFGNAEIDVTTRNARYLHQEWKLKCPIAKGAGETFWPNRVSGDPPVHIHGHDGLGNVAKNNDDFFKLLEGAPPLDPRPAAQFMIDTINANPPQTVSIVAVGRMTNLANALKIDPSIAERVQQVVIMGGAFDVKGNVTPAAEANIHGDPEAADVVCTAKWPLRCIGLDVTMQTIMTRTRLKEIADAAGKRGQLLFDVSQFYLDFYEGVVDDGMAVHDSCACAYVVAPELFQMRSGPVRVVCGGLADGMTIQKPDGKVFGPSPAWEKVPSQQVAIGIDAPAILKLIHDSIVSVKEE
uniref:Inosine/uridine-preferring nucleoside hydrolase domain-containing protein n=1 Tax=Amphora coffeiformis TaxID=265554 RepID=A0A7S3L5G3_9STRA|mmetsp:Transcript_24084/g.45776  ORF Transcript_24084/g.45776 Transcript_24084/m.45776 type:complete len:331 (+) Transcript_24084:233-1225(+)|eukprot:scaffold3939_cov166-Amphora_coffeaeformis.AAC.20